MTDKTYIVANEEQEREVLEKLELEGYLWAGNLSKPTSYIPSIESVFCNLKFPLVIFTDTFISWNTLKSVMIKNYEIVYDGRKEENMSNKLDRALTIFTNNGQSFMFKHVTDFKYTTTGFEFSYTGVTTGVERHAVFNNTSVAGYALAD